MSTRKQKKAQGSGPVALIIIALLGAGFWYAKQQTPAKRAAQRAPQEAAATAKEEGTGLPPIAAIFPRDCVAAVVLNTGVMGQLLDGAGAKEIRQDPAWGPYWDAILRETSPEAAALYELGSRVFSGEIALACLALDLKECAEPGYLPPIALAGRLASASALLPGFLQTQLEKSQPAAQVRVSGYEWEGAELVRATVGKSVLYAATVALPSKVSSAGGGESEEKATPAMYAVLSWRPDTVATLTRLAASTPRLAANREFQAMARKFELGAEHALMGFVDVGTLRDQVYAHYQRESRRDSLLEWQFLKTRRLIDFLGLQELNGVGVAIKLAEDGVYTHSYVHLGNLAGAMKMFAVPPAELEGVAYFPPNTVLCSVSRIDVSNVWRTLRRDLTQIDLNLTQALDEFLSATERDFGFNPESLVLSLGDEWGYGVVEQENGGGYGTLAFVRTKDNALVRAAAQLAGRLGIEYRTYGRERETIHCFGEFNFGDYLPQSLTLAPALAFVDGYTLVGSNLSVVEAAIAARRTGNDVTTAPEWESLFRNVPANQDGLAYLASTYRECLLTVLPQRPRMFDLSGHTELFTSAVTSIDYHTGGVERRAYSPSGSDVLLKGLSLLAAAPDVMRYKEWWLDMQTERVLEQVAEAKAAMAEQYNLTEGTVVTADGTGKNTFDLIVAGLLPATPVDPRSGQPIVLNPIGQPPRLPTEAELAPAENPATESEGGLRQALESFFEG